MLGWNGVLNTSMITIAWWEPSIHCRIWIPWETGSEMQSCHNRQQKLICIAFFSSLYIAMGFFGYLKYGADIASTITLNMDLVCFNLFVLFFTSTSPSITLDLSPHPSALALSSSSFFLIRQYCRKPLWPRLLLGCSALPSSSPMLFRFAWATKSDHHLLYHSVLRGDGHPWPKRDQTKCLLRKVYKLSFLSLEQALNYK